MPPIELAVLKFWNAASFHRRAPDRDQTNAMKVLRSLALDRTLPGAIRKRASEIIIKGYTNEPEPAQH